MVGRPSLGSELSAAHTVAYEGLDPPIACMQYNPPDQSVTVVYPARRRAGLAYATTDAPFEQYPYLSGWPMR